MAPSIKHFLGNQTHQPKTPSTINQIHLPLHLQSSYPKKVNNTDAEGEKQSTILNTKKPLTIYRHQNVHEPAPGIKNLRYSQHSKRPKVKTQTPRHCIDMMRSRNKTLLIICNEINDLSECQYTTPSCSIKPGKKVSIFPPLSQTQV